MSVGPPAALQPELVELLYQALASPCGIAIATNDTEAARNKLYAQRVALADETLSQLRFSPAPTAPDQELWITKRPGAAPLDGVPSDAPA